MKCHSRGFLLNVPQLLTPALNHSHLQHPNATEADYNAMILHVFIYISLNILRAE